MIRIRSDTLRSDTDLVKDLKPIMNLQLSSLPKTYRRQAGFTLIEMMVVIMITGVLTAAVVGTVNSARNKANNRTAQATIRSIRNAIHLMEIDTNYWPGREAAAGSASPQPAYSVHCNSSTNEVQDLNDAQTGLTQYHAAYPGWNGPYITTIPDDPWGNPYFFDTDYSLGGGVEAAVVGSYGPNGEGNNVYDSDNVIEILHQDTCS